MSGSNWRVWLAVAMAVEAILMVLNAATFIAYGHLLNLGSALFCLAGIASCVVSWTAIERRAA